MYRWIWRHLPGGRWTKTACVIGLVIAMIVLLFAWVFPAISPLLPFQQQTVGG